ncbi:MAG: hypothetical protein ACE14L_02375 [Terriglobales bacterium]
MQEIIRISVVALEAIFCLGLFGSALVILLTSIEDVREVLEKDEPQRPPE